MPSQTEGQQPALPAPGKGSRGKGPQGPGNSPPPSPSALPAPPGFTACPLPSVPCSEQVLPGRASARIYGLSWHIALPGWEQGLRPPADPHHRWPLRCSCPLPAQKWTWEKVPGPSGWGMWGAGTSQDLKGSGQGRLGGRAGERGQRCRGWTLGSALQGTESWVPWGGGGQMEPGREGGSREEEAGEQKAAVCLSPTLHNGG